MNKVLKTLPILISLIFVSCSDQTTSNKNENLEDQQSSNLSAQTDGYQVAIDNASNTVSESFEGYKVTVYTDTKLDGMPSQSSKAIYGNIDGKNTTSLLSVSGNYSDGDSFKVKVYKNDKLVGESDSVTLTGEYVKFNDIETNKE